jgi:hypothetical protein
LFLRRVFTCPLKIEFVSWIIVARSFVKYTERFDILTAKDSARYKIFYFAPPPPEKHTPVL